MHIEVNLFVCEHLRDPVLFRTHIPSLRESGQHVHLHHIALTTCEVRRRTLRESALIPDKRS